MPTRREPPRMNRVYPHKETSGGWTRFKDDAGLWRRTPDYMGPEPYSPIAPIPREDYGDYDLRGAGKGSKALDFSKDSKGVWRDVGRNIPDWPDPPPKPGPKGDYFGLPHPPKMPFPAAGRWLGPFGTWGDMIGVGGQVMDWLDPTPMPSGYTWPWGAATVHWGPYDCGHTPYLGMRYDNGYLDEGIFACLPGQVMQGIGPTGIYGDPVEIADSNGAFKSITFGRWNGFTRFTVIEHWYWEDGVARQPAGVPIPYRQGGLVPTPSLTPPEPWLDSGFRPTPASPPWPRWETDAPPKNDVPPARPLPPWFIETKTRSDRLPPRRPPGAPPWYREGVPHIPQPGEKKRKIGPGPGSKLWDLYKKAGDIYGGLTEIADVLDCLEKAAGKDYRAPRGLAERVAAMAGHINAGGQMNWTGALKCMAVNQVTDFVIGKANDIASKAVTRNRHYRRGVGYGTGSWIQRRF